MKKEPFVSVVLPVYNDSERLKKCLELLLRQTYPKDAYDVTVVDNGSEQDIKGVVSFFPGVRYAFEAKSGPAAARNKGVSLSQGEIIAFIDSDCRPHLDWIEQGVKQLMSEPDISAVGGEITTYPEYPDRPTLVEVYSRNQFRQKEFVEKDHFAAGANIFVKRKAFDLIGPFDVSFSLCACEDREWGERAYALGYRMVFAPLAIVEHPTRRTLAQMSARIGEFAMGNFQYELKRYKEGKSGAPSSFMNEAVKFFKPPLRSTKSYLSTVKGLRKKIGLYGIILYDHYTRVWVNSMVRAGWRPDRSVLRKPWSSK